MGSKPASAGMSISSINSASLRMSTNFRSNVQRELRAEIAATVSYLGSRSGNRNIGGINAVPVNINQLDPIHQSFGPALQQSVANPFFGNPALGALSRSATIARGQLLRPYPQFKNLFAHRVSAGRARYDSLALKSSGASGMAGDCAPTTRTASPKTISSARAISSRTTWQCR